MYPAFSVRASSPWWSRGIIKLFLLQKLLTLKRNSGTAIGDFPFSRSRVRPGTLYAYSAPLSCLHDSTLRILRTQETEVSPRVLGLAVDVGVSLEQN